MSIDPDLAAAIRSNTATITYLSQQIQHGPGINLGDTAALIEAEAGKINDTITAAEAAASAE